MLPKLQTAILTKTIILPISQRTVKIRPFIAKEEKLLLMVKESENTKDIIDICADVINACCFGAVDVKKLPAADVEKLFLEIRCLSKGETVDVTYICRKDLKQEDGTTKKCNTPVEIAVNLSDVEFSIPANHKNMVPVKGTNYVVEFRYPTVEDSLSVIDSNEITVTNELVYDSIINLIVSIIDTSSGVIYSDFTKDELKEFIDNLPFGFFGDVAEIFITSMPSFKKTIRFTCTNPECKHTEEITVKGFKNFF